ncbi:MAG: 2-dehydro-3-deoxyphosphogluconate aldolase, partial [Lentisphaerae bacterium]|nr:2-dehydro-3-deoxyphosphogluconate aldolase [Lentisphaerota bacterium]
MMDAILDTIFAERVVVLARGVPVSAMPKVVAALKAGGVKVMEVTFAPADPDTLSKT